MKKNTMMRIASFLLIAVLLSTSAISGTYAKYVTADKATDSARVAKWGVEVKAENNTGFGKYYFSQANGNSVHGSYEASTDTVKSSNDENVVAPGTNGTMATIKLSGTPEVDFFVSYSAQFSIGDKWTDGTSYYCPLIVHITKLDGSVTSVYGTSFTDAASFAAKVNDEIAACSFGGKAGTDLSTLSAPGSQVFISWEWPFETGASDTEKAANNIKDTYLGNQAAADNAAQIYLEVTCTVSQVD